ncbi:MAG TPA: sugar O-acetyltransferase [Alphaproteobacteria bacterium]|nr:sugar O-acetyltransferase [Alphaproteobacteria bacterium]
MATPPSEADKMRAGEWYLSPDAEILALQARARAITLAMNGPQGADPQQRMALLKSLIKHLGTNSWVETPFHAELGVHIEIGSFSFLNFGCVLLDSAPIRIGDRVAIGPNVQMYTPTHPLRFAERARNDADGNPVLGAVTRALPIEIGDGCWIGGGAIILPGVTIGPRTTIGAGSVVTQSVPADVFAAGNPCRVIRPLAP